MEYQLEDRQATYVYDSVVDFQDGRWDFSTSKTFESPILVSEFKSGIGPMRRLGSTYNPVFTGGTREWNSTVALIEAEDAPAFSFLLDPPQVFIEAPGGYASCTLLFSASNYQSALSQDSWSMTFDLAPWFDPKRIKSLALEDEAIGSEGHLIAKHFSGPLSKTLSKAKVTCTVNIKDAYIATGFTFSVSFIMIAMVRGYGFRPYL